MDAHLPDRKAEMLHDLSLAIHNILRLENRIGVVGKSKANAVLVSIAEDEEAPYTEMTRSRGRMQRKPRNVKKEMLM